MKNLKLFFFIALLNFFTLQKTILNDPEEIPFDGTSYTTSCTNCDSKYYKILYNSSTKPTYLKIEVSNSNTQNHEYVIAFSSTDQECLEREQLSNGNGKAVMFLKRTQLNSNIYLNVKCSSAPCSFDLNLLGDNSIELNYNEQYSYYVTENNQDMDFDLVNSDFDLNDNEFLSLWITSNKNAEYSIDSEFEMKEYSKKQLNKLKLTTNKINESIILVKVSAKEGDVINLGSFITGNNFLSINNQEIKGYLQKDFSNEDCYQFEKNDLYEKSEEFYLNVNFYSKIAEIYFKDESGAEVSDTIKTIDNGYFSQTFSPKTLNYKYFCIRFPTKESSKYDINEIAYNVQLTDPKQSETKLNLFQIQNLGQFYERRLQSGEIFLFSGPFFEDVSKMTYDMLSEFGFPDLLFGECTNYPLCVYDELKIENPKSINDHSSYKKTITEKKSPIDPEQNILVVKCIEKETCGFKTLIYSDITYVNLIEKNIFTNYINNNEKNYYKIDYSGEKTATKIYLDLMIFTGDVMLEIDSKVNINKVYAANKVLYSIKLDSSIQNNEFIFNVTSSKNSYYSIQYSLIRDGDDSWITNKLKDGISYMVIIDPEATDQKGEKKQYKIVQYSNLRTEDNLPFLVNFYSLNCKLNITAKRYDTQGNIVYNPIESFGNYFQDIIEKDDPIYNTDPYEYNLTIISTDLSDYNNKLCMVYASSLELNTIEELDEKQILLSDNEPKQIVFKDDYDTIQYLYPHSDPDKDVIIKFNLLDIAKYSVDVSFDHTKPQYSYTYTQTGNDIIYLSKNEWKNICKQNNVCPIIFTIKLDSTFVEKNPQLLISVKNVQDSVPSYLTKNEVYSDFLLGENWQYYFTELGQNDEADVIVNYRRGSGRLYGKIVQKDATVPEEGSDWHEMYKFPKTVEESLYFYGYIKKLIISKENTTNCQNGCYLLLSLKTSIVANQTFDYREHPFSIVIHNVPVNTPQEKFPVITLPLEEYITGNIYKVESNNINEYFYALFPHDAEKIIIDIQSKVVNFYINVGSEKPTVSLNDFSYLSNGQDTIYEISKSEFLNKAKEKGIEIPVENSLKGLSMTIGLYTTKTDSLYTAVYTFKVHLPFSDLNIYDVKSDQKTLCKTTYYENKNLCLFMIHYLGIDYINQLLLFPTTQNHSPYEMHAGFVEQVKYEFFDHTYIRNNIPTKESLYTTSTSKLSYIYVEHGLYADYFLFVSVETENPTIVELLTSFYTDDKQLSPNPSTPVLFVVKNEQFLFEFTTEEDLIINFVAISGEGEVYWEKDDNVSYYLRGKDDRLALTSTIENKSDLERLYSKLMVKNHNWESIKYTAKCPGFAFYINYLLRTPKINLDELVFGKSTNFAYRETDFPVYIYSSLKSLEKDTNVFINFYELISPEGEYSQFSTDAPFELKCMILSEEMIYDIKLNPENLPDFEDNKNIIFNGFYDSAVKTGYIHIKKNDFQKVNITIDEKPILVMKINKNSNYKGMTNFKRINLEAAVIQESIFNPISEKIYQYGKLNLNNNKHVYVLQTNSEKKLMRIHFSANSGKINWAISTNNGDTKNSSFSETRSEFLNGRILYTFNSNPDKNDFLYLTIFHDDDKAESEKITNYVFKYINSINLTSYKEYKLSDSSVKINVTDSSNDKKNYNLIFSPVTGYEELQISYMIKFVSKDDMLDDEDYQSIAVTESKSFVKEYLNPEVIDGKISIEINNINEIDYRYVQVIAQIKDKNIVEYVSYDSIYIKKSIVWIVVLVVAVCLFVVVAAVYILWRIVLPKCRKNLQSRIENASFEGDIITRESQA